MTLKVCNLTRGLIFSTVITGTTFANQGYNAENFAGAYGGLGFGVNSLLTETTSATTYDTTSLAPTLTRSYVRTKDKTTPLVGNLELGYIYPVQDNYSIGVATFINLSSQEIKNKLYYSQLTPAIIEETRKLATIISPLSGGIDLEPGFAIAEHTLLNGIFGWSLSRQKIKATHKVQHSSSNSGFQQDSKEKILNGIRLGLGIAQQFSSTLSVGLRYVYTDLLNEPDLTLQPINTTLVGGGVLNGPFSYKLKKQKLTSQSIMVNLRYRFKQKDNKYYFKSLDSNYLNGFYINSQLGTMLPALNNNKSHIFASYLDRGGITVLPQLSSPITSQHNSPVVNVGIGLGKIFNNKIYLGLEGALGWSKKEIISRLHQEFRPLTVLIAGQAADSISQKLKIDANNFEPALSSKFGIILPYNLLVYTKVGAAINTVETTINSHLKYIAVGGGSQTVFLSSKDRNNLHLKLGAGIEYQFNPRNTFSLNYNYTDYGKYDLATTVSTIDGAANPVTLTDTTKLRLRNNEITIGFSHYFNS